MFDDSLHDKCGLRRLLRNFDIVKQATSDRAVFTLCSVETDAGLGGSSRDGESYMCPRFGFFRVRVFRTHFVGYDERAARNGTSRRCNGAIYVDGGIRERTGAFDRDPDIAVAGKTRHIHLDGDGCRSCQFRQGWGEQVTAVFMG